MGHNKRVKERERTYENPKTLPKGRDPTHRPYSGLNYYHLRNGRTMNTPNWQKNSGKQKKGHGMCKGQLKARKQALKALKAKLA